MSAAGGDDAGRPRREGEPEVVFSTADPNEALLVKSLLEGSGIEAVLLDEHFSRLESPLAFVIGGVKVLVPGDQVARAREALEEYRVEADQDPVRGRNSPLDATDWHPGDDE
ncbi:MAG: DUF2007 domain-containing protein [Acidobacteria bacterium]|nr:MAG: DUF2007 domain-containing protein [Acidobacteriota bacterium]REK07766.1 MAG: DUF2007 domain-containing protein [Acidobacteriota bacterium]